MIQVPSCLRDAEELKGPQEGSQRQLSSWSCWANVASLKWVDQAAGSERVAAGPCLWFNIMGESVPSEQLAAASSEEREGEVLTKTGI